MIKRFVVLLGTFIMMISLSACGNVKIEGIPSEVISQAQSLATDKTATVTVTGYVVFVNEKDDDLDYWCIHVGDERDHYKNSVLCFFDSDPGYVSEGSRVTVTGTVKGSSIYSDSSISMRNCTMK